LTINKSDSLHVDGGFFGILFSHMKRFSVSGYYNNLSLELLRNNTLHYYYYYYFILIFEKIYIKTRNKARNLANKIFD